ncbi:DUF1349 domain-containing protein [Agromyces subbeticus]|uniref:DUF1349 domain-containing protein n=1 Tax=Agromyces subbeticus TaxID=293890 RepID=UPI00146D0A7C|nr:DUF1349 domain-containing protein [Agromyces subbeticus]
MNPDPAKLSVADGKLKIHTTAGDFYGTNNGTLNNMVTTDQAGSKWNLQTKLQGDFTKQWQQAGIIDYVDQKNWIKAAVMSDGTAGKIRFQLSSEINDVNTEKNLMIDASPTGDYLIRLARDGSTYSAEVSVDDGATWQAVSGTVTNAAVAAGKVGLMATAPLAGADQIDVTFDYIEEASDPAPVLDVPVVAGTRCIAGKVLVTVKATNNEAVPMAVTITSAYGTKSFAEVAPGKNATHVFTTRQVNVPAGTVTVEATATIDGTPVTQSIEAAYDAATCN